MKKSTLALAFTFSIFFCFSQTSTVDYLDNSVGVEASTENLLNPERGFYVQRSTAASFVPLQPLIPSDLQYIQNTYPVTLILRLYYLDAYTNSPIHQDFIDMILQDAATLRQAGMKAILRFAYNSGTGDDHGHGEDASYSQVLDHIDQLNPTLHAISDVIAVVQAGFVGSYGEWAYADPSFYIGDPASGVKDETRLKNVVEALLDALPSDRMIQVRTPFYKIGMYQTGTGAANALPPAAAYNGSAIARIGHHNDCFLGSFNDYYTYLDPVNEYPYLAQDTRFLPMGGETCFPINTDNREDCSSEVGGQADIELDQFHWSYLNSTYYEPTINDWNLQEADPVVYGTCLEDIQRRLGYRFELQHASYAPTTLDANCPLNVNIVLKNRGYASPYNPRDVELVLVNTGNQNDLHIIPLPNQDPRYWFKESELSEILINEVVNIPPTIADGTYQLYLHLPDPELTLNGDPDFSIQLANTNVWDPATGYNDLKQTITISAAGNIAPVVGNIDAPIDPQQVGAQIDASSDFIDACDSDDHTASWDWGDGSNTDAEGQVDQVNNTVTGSHIYNVAGVYTVALTVTDGAGGYDTKTFEFVVVYDPGAGFVTGGGWINSPPGACPTFCNGATGKANFGFVSKYKKGASVPTGNTQFQFKAGDLNFHSTTYEWLVIAGAKAMFKGNGTINGGGDYSFQISAIDGQVNGGGGSDKFRIKIRESGGGVVYDNQPGSGDNDDPTTTLGGGSIKIHKSGNSNASIGLNEFDNPLILQGYVLEQNFPNPFQQITTIRFAVPERSKVEIRVYDLQGRQQATLVDGVFEGGQHQIVLKAEQLPPGVYLYEMQAAAFHQIRKLILFN